jgi:hypothetical protein
MKAVTRIEAVTRMEARTEEVTATEVATRTEVATWMETPRCKAGAETWVQLTGPGRGATGAQARRCLLQLTASYPHRLLRFTRLSSADFGPRTSLPNLWLW